MRFLNCMQCVAKRSTNLIFERWYSGVLQELHLQKYTFNLPVSNLVLEDRGTFLRHHHRHCDNNISGVSWMERVPHHCRSAASSYWMTSKSANQYGNILWLSFSYLSCFIFFPATTLTGVSMHNPLKLSFSSATCCDCLKKCFP